MISSASDHVSANNLLVNEVFRKIWISTGGTREPNGVGTPPLQIATRSPTGSDIPSDLAGVETPPLAKHP